MIDWNKPIEFWNGGKYVEAYYIGKDPRNLHINIICVVGSETFGTKYRYVGVDSSGYYSPSTFVQNKKEEKKGWINIYKNGYVSKVYPTEELANQRCGSMRTRVACVKVGWKE